MKTYQTATVVAVLAAAFLATPLFAAETKPDEAEMMKQMMELSKLNENHKLLGELAGDWTNEVKMWMAPGAPPMVSKGTCTRKPIMEGRYYVADFNGSVKMPDEKGQWKEVPFHGTSLEGYDNVKKKFVSAWADNMGTGLMISEGTYDPASKTFTYTSEVEMMPGVKSKVREVIKVVDKDHHTFEYYENQGGHEVKTMEIAYTRAK